MKGKAVGVSWKAPGSPVSLATLVILGMDWTLYAEQRAPTRLEDAAAVLELRQGTWTKRAVGSLVRMNLAADTEVRSRGGVLTVVTAEGGELTMVALSWPESDVLRAMYRETARRE